MGAGRAKISPAWGPAARRWRHPTGARLVPRIEVGFEGAGTPLTMGCRGAWKRPDWRFSGQTPASGQSAIRLHGGKRLDAEFPPRPEGCNGRAPASPLPRWCCTTTHILRSAPTSSSARYRSPERLCYRTRKGSVRLSEFLVHHIINALLLNDPFAIRIQWHCDITL